MKIELFINKLKEHGLFNFFCGVPDSLLQPLNDYLFDRLGLDEKHIVAANEGNCVGIAAGYYMATGNVPIVYMQNSGIGNAVNPVCSLLNAKVYGIPCFFIVGLRGEVGVKDEPQHVFQGEISKDLLECIGIKAFMFDTSTTGGELDDILLDSKNLFEKNESVAILVRKGAFESELKVAYKNAHKITRELIINTIVDYAGDDIIVCSTGKASRELFEIRESRGQGHSRDFLTVGSMGHSLSIAFGICKQKVNSRVWCIDGDGSTLMHMGSMAVVGGNKPHNLIHILINNECHETVGGMPTVSNLVDYTVIAKGCGYENIYTTGSISGLSGILRSIENGLTFIEIKCAVGARADLGRPTTTAKENKEGFMKFLESKN